MITILKILTIKKLKVIKPETYYDGEYYYDKINNKYYFNGRNGFFQYFPHSEPAYMATHNGFHINPIYDKIIYRNSIASNELSDIILNRVNEIIFENI